MKATIKNIITFLLIFLVINIICLAQEKDSNIRIIKFNRIGQQEVIKKGEYYRIIYGVANPENTRIRYQQSNNDNEYILELVHYEDLVKEAEKPDLMAEELNKVKRINDSLQNANRQLSEKESAAKEQETALNEQDKQEEESINKKNEPITENSEDENIKNQSIEIADFDAKLFTNKAKLEKNVKDIDSLQKHIKNMIDSKEFPEEILKLQEELDKLIKEKDALFEEKMGLSEAKIRLLKDIQRQKEQMIYLIIIIVLILILAIAFYFNYRSKKKANIQLQKLNEELADKNHKISEAHRQITDSINYALKIQQAVIPNNERLGELLSDFFVLFRPKSVVSGDFYWIENIDGYIFIAVVDCTGHGVPGAFMSIIGNDLLNQIIKERKIFDPAKILHELHIGVRSALQQKDVIGEQQDGMETCLVMIKDDKLTYAGAKRPLWYVKNGKFHEIKGNRKPIGGRQKEEVREFDNHVIDLDSKITIYLTSDGYADQNDPNNRSYTTRRLKNFLDSIADKNMIDQHKLLSEELERFSNGEPNRDDISILGFKISPRGKK
jgi:serine phosphatase RsbU (regulator of sigma subunit)